MNEIKEINIRKYIDSDREFLRDICKATANKKYIKNKVDEEILCSMYMDYYIDNEKDNCFVATNNDIPVGYIICSTNIEKFNSLNKKIYIPRIRKHSLVKAIFQRISISISYKLNKLYNGGFHINISKDFQGQKIGPRLLNTLGKHLYDSGYKYMYLITENKFTRGYLFYKHFGFYEVKHYFGGSIALVYDVENCK